MKPHDSTPSETNDDPLAVWVAATLPRALAYTVTLVRQRSDAEDLVHDCYVRLLAKSQEYDLPNDGTKLLYRSITNACINWHQRRRPSVSLESLGTEDGPQRGSAAAESNPEHQAMHNELQTAIGDALTELPVMQRAAIELRSLGHSMTEVADILELTHGNARVVLHRARQALAVRLNRFLIAETEEER